MTNRTEIERRAWKDRRQGEERRACMSDIGAELVRDRRKRARREALRRAIDSARFNAALSAWHAGPSELAAWQAVRKGVNHA